MAPQHKHMFSHLLTGDPLPFCFFCGLPEEGQPMPRPGGIVYYGSDDVTYLSVEDMVHIKDHGDLPAHLLAEGWRIHFDDKPPLYTRDELSTAMEGIG